MDGISQIISTIYQLVPSLSSFRAVKRYFPPTHCFEANDTGHCTHRDLSSIHYRARIPRARTQRLPVCAVVQCPVRAVFAASRDGNDSAGSDENPEEVCLIPLSN